MKSEPTLWDYASFMVLVLFSILLGLYSRIASAKDVSKESFSFATGSVSSFSVLISVARTGIGIRLFLGIPGELVYRGSGMWEGLYGVCMSFLVVGFIFMPVYFAMPTTSIYQYLELRFRSGTVRRLTSFLYVVRSVFMLGITTLTPSVAIRAVLGVPYWTTILCVGLLSILFTLTGGMRGIILNDVLQAIVMFGFTILIIVKAMFDLPDGIPGAFKLAADRGRLQFFNFDPDPTIRVTTLSALIGQVFTSTAAYGCQQAFAQRYRSLPTKEIVLRTLLLTSPAVAILESSLWVVGVIAFAMYANCDPLAAGLTQNIDEILPFYIQQQFSLVPGLLGIFVASLFNGALGVSVAILNSIATVTWEDFLSKIRCVQNLQESKQLIVIRILGCFYGFCVMGMALAVATLPGLVEASQMVSALSNGPLLGVFLLALLFPVANKKGAVCGIVCSLAFTTIMNIGRLAIPRAPTTMLPLQVDQCPADLNITETYRLAVNSPEPIGSWIVYLFSITFMYYSALGCMICIICGLIVSYLTGSSANEVYEEMLIHPWAKTLSEMWPGKPRKYISAAEFNKSLKPYESSKVEYITHL